MQKRPTAKYNSEWYRSGHNEAVLKTVCPQGHVGSNPTLSAHERNPIGIPFLCAEIVGFERRGRSSVSCDGSGRASDAFAPKAGVKGGQAAGANPTLSASETGVLMKAPVFVYNKIYYWLVKRVSPPNLGILIWRKLFAVLFPPI